MKTCSFVFVLAVAILALVNAETGPEKAKRILDECKKAGETTPDKFCVNVKLGLMKENGDIDKDELKATLSKVPNLTSTMVDDMIAQCGERNGATAAEAAEAFDKCMKDRYMFHLPGTRFTY